MRGDGEKRDSWNSFHSQTLRMQWRRRLLALGLPEMAGEVYAFINIVFSYFHRLLRVQLQPKATHWPLLRDNSWLTSSESLSPQWSNEPMSDSGQLFIDLQSRLGSVRIPQVFHFPVFGQVPFGLSISGLCRYSSKWEQCRGAPMFGFVEGRQYLLFLGTDEPFEGEYWWLGGAVSVFRLPEDLWWISLESIRRGVV